MPSALLNKKGRFEVFCSRSIFGLLGREFSLIKSILKKLEKNNLQSTLLNRKGTAFQEVRILFTGINYVNDCYLLKIASQGRACHKMAYNMQVERKACM